MKLKLILIGFFCLSLCFAQNELTPLQKAIKNNEIAKVEELISSNKKEINDYLFWALECNNLAVMKLLLKNGASPNSIDGYGGNTVLMYAAGHGKLDAVKLLLEKGAKLKELNSNGQTAIIWAADRGRLEVVKYLIEQGADYTWKDDYGQTPIVLAAAGGHLELVKFFLAKGIDINEKEMRGYSPVMVAARKGKLNVVTYLVEKGADLSIVSVDKENIVDCSVRKGRFKVVLYLMNQGIKPTKTKDLYSFLLMGAIRDKNVEFVKRFLQEDINLAFKDRNVSFLKAAVEAGNPEVFQVIIDALLSGEKIPREKQEYEFVFYQANLKGYTEIVKLMLDRGMSLDGKRYNSLHGAARGGNLETVKLLLESGADLHTKYYNDSVLHAAAGYGHLELVEFFVSKGISVNVQNDEDYTPLHSAANRGRTDVIEYLISKGADFRLLAKYGSPIFEAVSTRNPKAALALLAHYGDVKSKDPEMLKVLEEALQRKYIELAMAVVKKGIDVTQIGNFGFSLFTLGCLTNDVSLIQLMVSTGIEIDKPEEDGCTPLMIAAGSAPDAVKLLLEKGADHTKRDDRGKTALTHAAMSAKSATCIRYLLEVGADPNVRDHLDVSVVQHAIATYKRFFLTSDEISPLHILVASEKIDLQAKDRRGKTFIVDLVENTEDWPYFLKEESSVEKVLKVCFSGKELEQEKETALLSSIHRGHAYLTISLIRTLSSDRQSYYKTLALIYACEKNKKQLCDQLLKEGVDPNTKNEKGQTVLMLAASKGNDNIVKKLLENNADKTIQDAEGKTALEYAFFENIVRLLKGENKGSSDSERDFEDWLRFEDSESEPESEPETDDFELDFGESDSESESDDFELDFGEDDPSKSNK